jgi:flagellar M-ring protein FliF
MDQIKKLLATLSMKQRWTILAAVVVVAAGMYAFSRWEQESSFRPLYNSLSAEDASAVVQKLKEGATPYRISNNGGTILVPEDKVAELRLEMAGAGVPKNGRIGFEIFDRTSFGMTDFAEHVNYRRALEGELERSIMSVTEIEQARVHISLPQDSVFLENRQAAKASVLVKIRPGASLPETAMPAMTNLVASAVEGLSAENVSVLDMRGNLLNRPKRTGPHEDDTSESALEYRHKMEQDLATKLDSTLEPLVGAGRFRTAVSAECDMTNGEQSEESFDPTRSVMVSSQKTEDVSTNPHPAGGVPGTASNLPDSTQHSAGGSSTTSRKTENIAYQSAHTLKRLVLPQGAIKRLSISVLLDQAVRFEGTGANAKRILEAPSPERMKVIHDLAAAAVGFDAARGDQLIVESLPFESTLNMEPPPSLSPLKNDSRKKTPVEQLKSDPKSTIEVGAILVVVLGGGFFLLYRKLKGSKRKRIDIMAQTALPRPIAEEAQARAQQDSFTPSVAGATAVPALAPGRIETLTHQLRATAQKDAQICAGVLRDWLREGA